MEKIGKSDLFRSLFLLFLFALSPLSGLAKDEEAPKPTVTATVSRNSVGLGQSFDYIISVESPKSETVGEPRLPDLEGFELRERSQGMEARSEYINGKFSFVRKQVYNYRLLTKKPGKLSIGRAEVVVGSDKFFTNPISIEVKKMSPQQMAQQDAQDSEDDTSAWDEADSVFDQLLRRQLPQAQKMPDLNDKEAFFIRVELDKKKVYTGEQITASWYLYTQNTLTTFDPVKYPDLKGFWKEDIQISTRLNYQTEIINGIPYRKALLVSYALFPIKPGIAVVDSYKLRASALMANPFGAFGKPFTFTKVNPPVNIEVLPVPTPQPEDFNGAVGQFQLSAKIDKATVPANEPFSLKLRIDGRGNAKQIELPTLNLPSEFETFDTKSDSKFSPDGTSYKEFEVLIIPRKEGALTIPAISMSYFNPETKKFEHMQTHAIAVQVGAGKDLNLSGASPLDLSKDISVKKVLSLPLPLLEMPHSFWSARLQKYTYLFTTLLFFISLIFVTYKELKRKNENDEVLKEILLRLKAVQDQGRKQSYKNAGISAINLIDFVLTEITQVQESSSLDLLLEKIPPSLKIYFDDAFRKSLRYFETLSFAPEEISKPLMNPEQFESELKIIKKALNESVKNLDKKS